MFNTLVIDIQGHEKEFREVNDCETVFEFLSKIKYMFKLPEDEKFSVYYGNKKLSEDTELRFENIKDGDTLEVRYNFSRNPESGKGRYL